MKVKRFSKAKIPFFNKKTGLVESEIAPKQKFLTEETLDKWFSKFIRLRDTMTNGYVRCVTCGSIHHWKDVDNGHFQTRNHINTKYNEKNCNVQCTSCNDFGKGEQYKHGVYIDQKYGKGTSEMLFNLAHSPTMVKLTGPVITEMANRYREKVNELLMRIDE